MLPLLLKLVFYCYQLGPITEWPHVVRAAQFITACREDCSIHRLERAEHAARIAVDEARLCPSNALLQATSLQSLACVLDCGQRYYEAIPVLEEALNLAKASKHQDKRLLSEIYSAMAHCYDGEGEYGKASEALLSAISVREELHEANDQEILEQRMHLALVQYDADKYTDCIKSCRAILKSQKCTPNKGLLALCSMEIGKSYEQLGKTNDAEAAFRNSVLVAAGAPKETFASHLEEAGLFYERAHDFAKATDFCGRSLKLREELFIDDAQKLNEGKKLVLIAQAGPWNREGFVLSLEKADSAQVSCSDPILAEVNRAISAMPPKVVEALARTGCRVVIVPTLGSCSQLLRTAQPTGYRDGDKFDYAGAVYENRYNLVLIPRLISSPWSIGMKRNHRALAVVRHELGHALDYYLEQFSSSKPFAKAYREERVQLSEKQKKPVAYYMQLDYRGRAETVAELFNHLCGGACSKETSVLLTFFPKSYTLFKQELTRRGLLEPAQSIAQRSGF